jgi:hypothetical protein
MISIEMLPAEHGDCLWIEYGDPAHPRRLLIDGGTSSTYTLLSRRIESLPAADRRFELLIVTHIDSDHIGGAVKLLDRPPPGLRFGDVWFNGFCHLPIPPDELGVRQAEELTRALGTAHAWNKQFEGRAVVVPEDGRLPRRSLEEGLEVTVLSPGMTQLRRLYPKWAEAMASLRAEQSDGTPRKRPADELGGKIDIAALAASPFKEDTSESNGSSIAVLIEYENRRMLLGADAHPSVLSASVDRLMSASGKSQLTVDAFKVAHHGSRANTSRKLLEKVISKNYLVSTNGAVFEHPDREGIARLIACGGREPTVYFNYQTDFNKMWGALMLESRYRYEAKYQSKLEWR